MKVSKFSCQARLQYGSYLFFEQTNKNTLKLLGGSAKNREMMYVDFDSVLSSQKANKSFVQASSICLDREIWEEAGVRLDIENFDKMAHIYFANAQHLVHVRSYTLTQDQYDIIKSVTPTVDRPTIIATVDEKDFEAEPRIREKHRKILNHLDLQDKFNQNKLIIRDTLVQDTPQTGDHALGFDNAALIPG